MQDIPVQETNPELDALIAKGADLTLEDIQKHNREAEEKKLKNAFIKEKTKSTFALAQYLTHIHNIITIGEKDREYYVYKGGMYVPAENGVIFPEVQRILGEHTTKRAKTETLHKIADMTQQPRSVFDNAPISCIPLKNGVYDREKHELLPHSPHFHFRYQFPIIYDEAAECPKTSAFLDQVLTPEQRVLVEEWMGYYFYRLYAFKKALILVGEGDTGKTTLLEVIMHLLGRDNISSISLQKMTGDKFAAAHLYGKHGNLVDELSAKDIKDTGNFKMATGGGSITGEYKFGNQFSFINFSKFTFACNRIPDVQESDDIAYFNRWAIVRFQKTIEKKIPNFIATLTTEEERSGLFNLAMKGLDRLLENGELSHTLDAMDTKREMLRSGSSIAQFASDCLIEELNNEVTKEDMYSAYTDFCIENGLSAETIKMLGTKLPFYVSFIADGRITDVTGKQVRGWRNAKVIRPVNNKVEEEFNNF